MQETSVVETQVPAAVTNEVAGSDAPVMTLLSYGGKLTRNELAQVPTPAGTATHKPIPHIEVIEKLVETLSFRQIGVDRIQRNFGPLRRPAEEWQGRQLSTAALVLGP